MRRKYNARKIHGVRDRDASNESEKHRQRSQVQRSSSFLEYQNKVEQEPIEESDQEKDDGIDVEVEAVDTKSLEDIVASQCTLTS